MECAALRMKILLVENTEIYEMSFIGYVIVYI